MTNIELLNKAYILRNAFIKEIEKYIFGNIVDTNSIYNIYVNYINKLTCDQNNYLEIKCPKPFILKKAKTKTVSKFFFWIYNMITNVHNAFISRFYNDFDMTLFFSGFSLNSDIPIQEALDIFKNQSPYDIEYIELLNPYDDSDFSIIKENNLIDLFFLYRLVLYFSKQSLFIYINYLNFFINKKKVTSNYIYNFCLNIYKILI